MAKHLSETEWDWITIQPAQNEYTDVPEWYVYGHGEYEESSVLAGQYRRCCLDCFPSVTEAQAAYPSADVINHTTRIPTPAVPSCPPEWFDPADAGERWDEDY